MPRTSSARWCSTACRRARLHAGHGRRPRRRRPRPGRHGVGLLQTAQQLGGAVGLAAIVSVYASRAVPGQFVPGVEPAFLTSASFTLVALLVAAVRAPAAPCQAVTEAETRADARDGRRRRSRRRRGELTRAARHETPDGPASGGVITPPDAGPSAVSPRTTRPDRTARGAGDDGPPRPGRAAGVGHTAYARVGSRSGRVSAPAASPSGRSRRPAPWRARAPRR